jgi:hypothetical protein
MSDEDAYMALATKGVIQRKTAKRLRGHGQPVAVRKRPSRPKPLARFLRLTSRIALRRKGSCSRAQGPPDPR